MNPDNNKKNSKKNYVKLGAYILILFVLMLICYNLFGNWSNTKSGFASLFQAVSPFLYGFILSYFLSALSDSIEKFLFYKIRKKPVPEKLEQRGYKRVISVIITYIIVVGVLIFILAVIIPQMIETISSLIDRSGDLYNNAKNTFDRFVERHPELDLSFVQEFMDKNMGLLFNDATTAIESILPRLYSISRSTISFIYTVAMTFILSIYFLWDKERIKAGILDIADAFLPKDKSENFREIAHTSNKIFGNFLIGKAIDSLIIGIITFVAMNLIGLFGVPGFHEYSLILSLIVGFTNMIPYFGPIIGAIPGILLFLAIKPSSALIFAIMILVIQQFDGNYLGPKILGNATGLAPIWVILAVVMGGYMVGVLGMFLGVPVVAVLVYLAGLWIDYKKKQKALSEEPADPGTEEKDTKEEAGVIENIPGAEEVIGDVADTFKEE